MENKEQSKEINSEETKDNSEEQIITEELALNEEEIKESEDIQNISLEDVKLKDGMPPKKLKVNGVVYYRKKESFEDNNKINDFDKKIIQKASKMKYRPPLSYRGLKILGMIALIMPFLLTRIYISYPDLGGNIVDILITMADAFALPLVIFAAFIIILKSENKLRLIIIYGVIAVLIYVGLVIFFERYLVRILSFSDMEDIRAYANDVGVQMKIFKYNFFIDLCLCATFFYFTNSTPRKLMGNSKKMLAFRLCALIPVVYVIVSMILSGLLHSGVIKLSVAAVGLLTCRSPATYLMFFLISLFISFSQKSYLKKGGTVQGFEEYKKTNTHSVMFSVMCSVILLFVCLLDFLFGLIPGSEAYGIGDSKWMFVIIPLIMLISYKKEHKSNTIDLFLPVITALTILFLIADTVFAMLF